MYHDAIDDLSDLTELFVDTDMSTTIIPSTFSLHLKTVFTSFVANEISNILRYEYRLGSLIVQYPFPYDTLIDKTAEAFLQDVCATIRCRLLFWKRHRHRLVRIRDMILQWYRNQRKKGVILARNARDGLPDKILPITYHSTRDAYFITAFSGRYPADMEDGKFVLRVHKLKTSQSAIEVFCASRYNGRRFIEEYLDQAASVGLERFTQAYEELDVLGNLFMDPVFTEKVNSFLVEYLNQTLYKLNGSNSMTRLQLYLDKSPVIAEYIWKANFSTKEARGVLGTALKISNRNMAGFKNAETVGDLKSFIHRKLSLGKSHLDDLPPKVWEKIQIAKRAHEEATKGVRVGLYGRYISSDAIEMTRVKLAEAWREADKWIGQKARTKI